MSDAHEIDAEAVLQHAGFVRSLARGLLRDESLVDDVVQETLTRAIEKGPRRSEALGAWLRAVTRNVVYKSYRGAARRQAREEDVARPEGLEATGDVVARSEMLHSLTAAVLDLPESAREVILLRYYESLGHGQIAERLGIGVGAARMRVHRAQVMLRERLDASSRGRREDWMGGLAVLAGIGFDELTVTEEAAVSAGASLAGAAWIAAVALALGALAWIAGPWAKGRSAPVVEVERSAALAAVTEPDTLADSGDRTRRSADVPAAVAFASNAATPPATEASDEPAHPAGDVLGTVVDASGNPVPNAEVLGAWGRENLGVRARTDASGRFGFSVPERILVDAREGRYPILLAAIARGCAPTRVHAWPSEFQGRSDLRTATGDPAARLELRGAGGALRGVVRGAKGPLAGARVEVGERIRLAVSFLGTQSAETENPLAHHLASRIARGERLQFKGNAEMRGSLGPKVLDPDGRCARLLPARRVATATDGSFRLAGLEPGIHRVRISARGHAPFVGRLAIPRGGEAFEEITLAGSSVLSGTVESADGLRLGPTLVHAIQDRPWTARTVQVTDGTFRIDGLRRGPVRVVAEERTPKGHTPARIAELEMSLAEATEAIVDLSLEAVATRPVLFVVREGTSTRPLAGQAIELRAVHNPLMIIAIVETGEDGRAELPLETVVPAVWLLTSTSRLVEIDGSKQTSRDTAYPLHVVDPPPLEVDPDGSPREALVAFDAGELEPRRVSIELDVGGDAGALRDVVLVPEHDVFTFKGTARPDGTVEFPRVPPGSYGLLVPYRGLGWLSPRTFHVPASHGGGDVDLGALRLPRLGELRLLPAGDVDATRWVDLSIQAHAADREARAFEGRVAVPATIPIAPGRYTLRSGEAPSSFERTIVVRPGAEAEVLWPLDDGR